jgi:predicted  nucleic acid-binding Zn-ribbon protein
MRSERTKKEFRNCSKSDVFRVHKSNTLSIHRKMLDNLAAAFSEADSKHQDLKEENKKLKSDLVLLKSKVAALEENSKKKSNAQVESVTKKMEMVKFGD